MTEFERYKILEQKYLKDTTSPEEEAEFLGLYDSGKFKELERAELEAVWNADEPAPVGDHEIRDRMFTDILTRSNEKETPLLLPSVNWFKWAAVLTLLAIVGALLYNTRDKVEPVAPQASPEITFFGPAFITLPDSTTVHLKDSSQLTYTLASFDTTQRRVKISGTAFFKVTKNPDVTFHVRSGTVVTSVLGTEFNVSERKDSTVMVTVIEGQVRVGDSTAIFGTLTPFHKMIVNTGDMTHATQTTTGEAELQWRRNNVAFEDMGLQAAIIRLEDVFRVKIKLENRALKDCPINAKFINHESLADILKRISGLYQAHVSISGHTATIKGGKGCGPKPIAHAGMPRP